jgi:hypothetical protein
VSIFGVTITPGSVGATVGRAAEGGAAWVRYNGFSWSALEPSRGARAWERMARADAELSAIAARGLTTIGVVQDVPPWARTVAGQRCGGAKPEALDAFAGFMRDLVTRYSAPPYNVIYWEIGNEPDIDPALVGPESIFGCWGNAADPYYGGGDFAEVLKRIYPAIKQANPAAQVLLGGLLLDCDPDASAAAKCASARFLEGVLRNGGGAAFDIVSYHGYAYWNGRNEDWDAIHSGWRQRGGVMLGKIQFIRTTLAQYQVSKPLLLSEAGLLCYRDDPACKEDFLQVQAAYVVRVYTRAWANGLLGAVWYTLNGPGWQKGGLLDANQSPRPAYQSFKFLAGRLRGASYDGPRTGAGVEGYAFHAGSTRYEVYWTNDDSRVALPLPPGTRAVYDLYGQPVPVAGPSLDVGFMPVIVEAGP